MAEGGDIVTPEEKDMVAGSGPDPETSCRSCLYEGTYNEGVWFCIDCEELLCSECYRYHMKGPLSRGHVVKRHDSLSTDEMQKMVKDMCTEICKKHEGKVLEYFCSSHDYIACSACITLDHKTCDDVDFIPNIAKAETTTEEVKLVVDKLKKLELQSKNIVELADENGKYTQMYCQKVMEDVEDVQTRVIKSLDEFKEGIKKELSRFVHEDSVKMTEVKALCSKIKQDVMQIRSKQAALQDTVMYCRLFCETKKNKTKIKRVEASLQTARQQTVIQKVGLNLDKTSENLIRKIISIGTLGRKDLGNSKLEYIKDISVRTPSDTSLCKITGISTLPGKMLALVDNNNAKIKVLDTYSGVITAELKMTSGPWEITTLPDTTIATTLPEERKVLFINADKTSLRVDKHITVSGDCRGLSYKDNTFVITYIEPKKVEIVNMDGVVIRMFVMDPLTPYFVQFSAEDDKILVSNPLDDKKSICILNMEGETVASHWNHKLSGTCAIIERDGFMVVCGFQSHNVHMINAKTRKFTEILGMKNGIVKPYSLCHDIHRSILYIGMRDKDIVKVYDIV